MHIHIYIHTRHLPGGELAKSLLCGLDDSVVRHTTRRGDHHAVWHKVGLDVVHLGGAKRIFVECQRRADKIIMWFGTKFVLT